MSYSTPYGAHLKKQGDRRNVSRPLARIHSTNQHTHKQPRLDQG